VSSVGVTSGASVPDDLVQGVLELLVDLGFPAAVEERLIEESLVFALPPELRKDLRRHDRSEAAH
jgi:4-hydroxy-3-methylbut-2-enyl diphosphate reductase